jgi:hypothetical protein
MSNKPRISVAIHRHGRKWVDDIADQVTKVEWSQSLSAPWQSLTVTWKATVRDSFTRVVEGDWVVFRIKNGNYGTTVALLHVDATSGGLSTTSSGGIATQACVFRATSWWNFLASVNIYSVLGWTEDVGTLLSIKSWGKILLSVTEEYAAGALAESFTKLFTELTKNIKLPETLFNANNKQNASIANSVRVICDQSAIPSSRYQIDSIDVAGGMPTRLASNIGAYESSIVDFLTGTYVSDPMLIELFPAPLPELAGDLRDETGFSLNLFNSLILRIKPFREVPLKDSTVAHAGYKPMNTNAAVSAAIGDALKGGPLDVTEIPIALRDIRFTADVTADQQKRTQYNAEKFLKDNFTRKTWDRRKFAYIDPSLVRGMTWTRDDRNRVNCSSIKLSFDNQTGIEGLLSAGLPITYDEDILRHGLRVSKPTWSYMINTTKEFRDRLLENKRRRAAGQGVLLPPPPVNNSITGGEWVAFARTICAQFMQFYKNNHMYLKGTVSLNLTDALRGSETSDYVGKVLSLQHGQGFVLKVHKDMDTIVAYCESISHAFVINDGGVEAGSTTIEYSRGHIGLASEALAKDVDVPIRSAPEQQTSTPTTTPVKKKDNCVVVSTYNPLKKDTAKKAAYREFRINTGIRIYATMRAAGFSPALSFALAHQSSHESGWDPDAVRWCIEGVSASDIGLFQINYAGLGLPKEGFQGNKQANTTKSTRFNPTLHWDASDPKLNCLRVIKSCKDRKLEASKEFDSPDNAYKAVWFESGLTSGAAKQAEYTKRAKKGLDTYLEYRADIVSASWSSSNKEILYTFNNYVTAQKTFFKIYNCNPSTYNLDKKRLTLSSSFNNFTSKYGTDPGTYVGKGILSSYAWYDPTFTTRFLLEEVESDYNPNNDYFKDSRSYSQLGVPDGIIQLLSLRY